MCGICGFNWENKQLIKKMTKVLEHRGPDDQGHYTDKNISLGHRRLSILDLSKAGKQPMSNKNGTIFIVYNGEVYNFKEIREKLEKKGYRFKSDTDTEVILYAYQEYGERCLELFNGMFALCIYDLKKKKLFIARDRIGIKPLYYYWDGKSFIFASEIKAILKEDIERTISLEALNNYICLRYNKGVQTLFEKIKKLPAGCCMEFDIKKKKLDIRPYWELNWKQTTGSENFFKKKLYDLLKESVKKRLISDVPLGVFLSGGVDSASIVALMRQIRNEEGGKDIKTFSVGFEQGEQFNELKEAKYISELFDTKHKEFMIKPSMVKILPKIIYHSDEPMADPALIPLYLLSEKATKKVTVVLTGDGGDEVFGGYDQYKFLLMGRKISRIPLASTLIPAVMNLTPRKILNKVYKYTAAMGDKGVERIERFLRSSKKNPSKAYYDLVSIFHETERKNLMQESKFTRINFREANETYFKKKRNLLKNLLYLDKKQLLPKSYLMKTDRMTMAHSLEARVPLLDHKLIEFGFSIPNKYKINRGKTKYILREAMTKHIPRSYLYKKKQTFHVPIDNWLQNDLKDYCKQMLSEENIKKQGYFNHRYIEKIFRNYNKSKLVHARQIWNLINFQIWHEMFIEKRG